MTHIRKGLPKKEADEIKSYLSAHALKAMKEKFKTGANTTPVPAAVHGSNKEALCMLIETVIASDPIELEGFIWAARPQDWWTAQLGFSISTLNRLIREPPFVRKRRKGMTLLRIGEPGPVTPYDLALSMSTIFRKRFKKQTTLLDFQCLLALASEDWPDGWPNGLEIELFKLVTSKEGWVEFMVGVKLIEPVPKFYEFPVIPLIRKHHRVAVDMLVTRYQEAGKLPPPQLQAITPHLYANLKPKLKF